MFVRHHHAVWTDPQCVWCCVDEVAALVTFIEEANVNEVVHARKAHDMGATV